MKIQLAIVLLLVLIISAQCSYLSHQNKHHKKDSHLKHQDKKFLQSKTSDDEGRCDGHRPPSDGHNSGYQLGDDIDNIEVSLSWESSSDLDVSIIVTNEHHNIIDVVYYSKQTSDDGAINHHGDSRNGDDSSSYDEIVSIDLNSLSSDAKHLYVALSVYSSEYFFPDVPNVVSDIVHNGNVIHNYTISSDNLGRADSATTLIISKIFRSHEHWAVQSVDIELTAPQDIRNLGSDNVPLIQPVLVCYETRECTLPEYAHVEHQNPQNHHGDDCDCDHHDGDYDREDGNHGSDDEGDHNGDSGFDAGDIFVTPQPIDPALETIDVGLAWETATDLDFSIIITNEYNEIIDSVYYNKQTSDDGSVTHHGDNRSGDASGYDETITIDLTSVDPNTFNFYITISVYSSGYYFDYVSQILSNIIGNGIVQHEFVINPAYLPNAHNTASAIIGKIYRSENDHSRWQVRALDAEDLTTFDVRIIKQDYFSELQSRVDCFDLDC